MCYTVIAISPTMDLPWNTTLSIKQFTVSI